MLFFESSPGQGEEGDTAMILIIDTHAPPALRVEDGADLKRLSARVRGTGDPAAARGDAGRVDADGTHLRIGVAALKQAAGLNMANATGWSAGFDGMIAYARSKGWVDGTGGDERVRVHIEAA